MAGDSHPKKKRHRRAKRKRPNDILNVSREEKWKQGRISKVLKVKGHPINPHLVETEEGYVSVRDSSLFPRGLEVPVWVEQGTGRLICKGQPRSRSKW